MKAEDVLVAVQSRYVAEQSRPSENAYVFAYAVTITNQGSQTMQVVSRQWVITDGSQNVQRVGGLGVVGRQPLLGPGEVFEYTSACPLRTPVGTMRGVYHCVAENGAPFQVPVNEFVLSAARILH